MSFQEWFEANNGDIADHYSARVAWDAAVREAYSICANTPNVAPETMSEVALAVAELETGSDAQ